MKSADRLMISFIGACSTVFGMGVVSEDFIDIVFIRVIGILFSTCVFYIIWNKMLESDKVKKK